MPSYSPFWGPNTNDYQLLRNLNPRRTAIRKTVNKSSFRAATKLFDVLIGATAGGAAVATHRRVGQRDSNTSGNNEARIVTVTSINRNTTSADVTALKEMVFGVKWRPSFPRDRSGNGGPALAA